MPQALPNTSPPESIQALHPPPSQRASPGRWTGRHEDADARPQAIREAVHDLRNRVCLVRKDGALASARSGAITFALEECGNSLGLPVLAFAPAIRPEDLGDPTFALDHGVRFAYMTGAMANGIASSRLVEAAARAGLLGSYGAAGHTPAEVEAAIDRLDAALPGSMARCFNLIHSPNEPALEERVTDIYLRRGVRLVEASAYLDLTPAVVRYRVKGLRRGPDGRVQAAHEVIAKASRVEVAAKWMSPAPEKILAELVRTGAVTRDEADLASRVPVACDVTAEADSGGHTDNRPAICLVPTFIALRDRLAAKHALASVPRVGAAGGIATPSSAAAAFAMGAAYIVTGSINQACVEAGTSDTVRKMLAEAEQADVIMAPAADMFELGVKLQVLKRGTMFAMRAQKLHDLYRAHGSLDEIPPREREAAEKAIFRMPLADVWTRTRAFFLERDPGQVEKAERDPRHKMALVFRWYLGLSSRWANAGEPTRQIDYQVWCGPAMGAFNEWTRGTFLADPTARRVATIAWNLLHGAAVLLRAASLRAQGAPLGSEATRVEPLMPERLKEILN